MRKTVRGNDHQARSGVKMIGMDVLPPESIRGAENPEVKEKKARGDEENDKK